MIKEILFGGAGGTTKLADVGLLVLRVFGGLSMALAHGRAKLLDPSMITGGLKDMHFPAPTLLGWMVILAELGGGLLLALGLLTRPAAFLIACTMAVAGFVAHASDPFQVKELAFLYLSVAILFLLAGGGRYSIDALIRGRKRKSRDD